MFGALHLVDGSTDALLEVARDFTPRFEICGQGALDPAQASEVVLDLNGLTRLFGHPRAIAQELGRAAAGRGLCVAVAIAVTCTAARLLAVAGSRQSAVGSRQERTTKGFLPPAPGPLPPAVVEPGAEAAAVAPLPLSLLAEIEDDEPRTLAPSDAPSHRRTVAPSHDLLATFRRWGLRTLGDLAALPADEIAARLGTDGLRWHRLAEGRDLRPLRPAVPEERFEQSLDLEWPIEGLEPLSFVLGRLLEPLAAHLERRGRGAAVLHLRLHLVTRAVYERSLQLPAPMRDARTLRTLLLLDLESHPAPAAIDRVVVAADPTPARVLQYSLLHRSLPSPEQLSTLTARLAALLGADRCGSPAVVDSWQPGAFGMKPFNPGSGIGGRGSGAIGISGSPIPDPRSPAMALRRFRFPVPARVRLEHERPVHVASDRRGLMRRGSSGGRVERCAGPWRTSGHWWIDRGLGIGDRGSERAAPYMSRSSIPGPRSPVWDRDEWDVTLSDGASYRLFRDRATSAWFVDGVYD
jgi:protein ImuB